MTTRPTLTTRTIGETENALRALLVRTLAGTGLDYHRWVALKLAAESTSPVATEALSAQLQGSLKIDAAGAMDVVRDLEHAGMFGRDGRDLALTDAGAAIYSQINDRTRALIQEMWTGLAEEDLAATQRVLSTITSRANALLAS